MVETDPAATGEQHSTPTPDSIKHADSIPTDGTSVIIAGSRSATDVLSDSGLQQLITSAIDGTDFTPDAIISGTASGVDTAGEYWAHENGRRPVARFPAPWDEHGYSAGPIRNEWMAQYAASHSDRGALLAIIDYPSSGTESMIDIGREYLGDDNVFVVPLGDITDKDAREELAPVIHRP